MRRWSGSVATAPASIFGGSDWHNRREDSRGRPTSIREIASGLSTSPTFFELRKGAAILDPVRMSPRFFGTGHFRSDGGAATGDGGHLDDRVDVPYHLPLPDRHRRRDGDYDLASEGRCYAEMDFHRRPRQYQTLETT